MRIPYNYLVTVLLVIGGVSAEYAPNIPVDSELDRLLVRLAARYGVQVPARFYLQPYTWADLQPFLTLSGTGGSHVSLSAVERTLLERAVERFGTDDALLHWEKPDEDLHVKVNVNLLGDVRPGYRDSASLDLFGIFRPSLAGNLGDISFYSGISVWTEYRSDSLFPASSYQPYDGIAYNLYGRDTERSHLRSSDLPYGGVRYETGRISLETAIDYLRCGPSRFYPVTLSGSAPPVTYMRAALDLGRVNYQHVAGLLKHQKDRRKFLFMHRLSTDIWKKRLHLGINEVIVYGNTTSETVNDSNSVAAPYRQYDRSFEWVYFIPLIPFKFVEHYAGDRDNAALSFDATLFLPSHFRWYLEFFLDDMLAPWKIFSNDWGNKWALSVGGGYFGRMFGRDIAIEAEYSRVEPWVYTHFSGGSHRYSHFNVPLGHPLGPNSQTAVLSGLIHLHPLHEAGVGLHHFAWNRTVRGGEITDVFQDDELIDAARFHDSTTKRFLGPGTKWFLQPALYWNFNCFGRFALRSQCRFDILEERGALSLAVSGGLYF